jgi:tetratricopeptide (TPR) repeat protein
MAEEAPQQRRRLRFEDVDQFSGPFGRRANAQRAPSRPNRAKAQPTRVQPRRRNPLRWVLVTVALMLGVVYWLIWIGFIDMDGARAAVLSRVAGVYRDRAEANAFLSKHYSTPAVKQGGMVDACERLVQARPEDPHALVLLGEAYRDEDDLMQASACYQKALEFDPNCYEAHVAVGDMHSEQGEYASAEAAYQRALAIRSDLADVHVALGLIYSNQGRYEQAMQQFQRGKALDPDVNQVEVLAGNAHMKAGFYEKAIASFKDALVADDKSAQAHFNLGRAYLRAGDRDMALQQQRKLEAMDTKMAARLGHLINQTH